MKRLIPTLFVLTAMTIGCKKSEAPAASPLPPAAAAKAAPQTMPTMKVAMTLIDERGSSANIGSVQLSDTDHGLLVTPALVGLPPGAHGFHLHQFPDCGAAMKDGKMTAGISAGEHYDPSASGEHTGPDGRGHAGDLPRLMVAADGSAATGFVVPRLRLAEVGNRSLVIHAEADDYAAAPGGARIACGVVQ
ncbi:MAG: superoxide dismutase family protein [Pseudomonadota bacterium]